MEEEKVEVEEKVEEKRKIEETIEKVEEKMEEKREVEKEKVEEKVEEKREIEETVEKVEEKMEKKREVEETIEKEKVEEKVEEKRENAETIEKEKVDEKRETEETVEKVEVKEKADEKKETEEAEAEGEGEEESKRAVERKKTVSSFISSENSPHKEQDYNLTSLKEFLENEEKININEECKPLIKNLLEELSKENSLIDDLCKVTFSILKNENCSSKLKVGALVSLRLLNKSAALQEKFRLLEGYNLLIPFLSSTDNELRAVALRFTGWLITKTKRNYQIQNAEEFWRVGGLTSLAKLLGDSSSYVRSLTCGTIRVLTKLEGISEFNFQEEMIDLIPPLVQIVLNEKEEVLVTQAISAIEALCDNNAPNILSAIKCGIIPNLITHIKGAPKAFNWEKNRTLVVSCLTVLMISDGIKVFVESKGLEALSELLSVDSASLLLASLKLAYSLSSQKPKEMKAIGIVDKIIEGIFKTTKPKLLREYILVGSALFQEEENKKEAKTKGVLEKLVEQLSSAEDLGLKSAILSTLLVLTTSNPENQQKLEELKVLDKIFELAKTPSKEYPIQATASSILLNCIENEKISQTYSNQLFNLFINLLKSDVNLDAQDAVFKGLDILLKKQPQLHQEVSKNSSLLSDLTSHYYLLSEKNIAHSCSILITLGSSETVTKKYFSTLNKLDIAKKFVPVLTNGSIPMKDSIVNCVTFLSTKSSKLQSSFFKTIPSIVQSLSLTNNTDAQIQSYLSALEAILKDNPSKSKAFSNLWIQTCLTCLESQNEAIVLQCAKVLQLCEEAKNKQVNNLQILINLIKQTEIEKKYPFLLTLKALISKEVSNQSKVCELLLDEIVSIINRYKVIEHSDKEKKIKEELRNVCIEIIVVIATSKNADLINALRNTNLVETFRIYRQNSDKVVQKNAIAILAVLERKISFRDRFKKTPVASSRTLEKEKESVVLQEKDQSTLDDV